LGVVDLLTFFRKRPYIFLILPGFVLYVVFCVAPIVLSIPLSFTAALKGGGQGFVGLQNYVTIFTDKYLYPQFINALKNSFLGLALTYFIVHPIIILLAYMIYRKIKGHGIFQGVLFLPQFINPVAMGFMVFLFFSPYTGLYYNFFNLIGLPNWGIAGVWSDQGLGVVLLVIVWSWKGLGYEMLLYIANFKVIPTDCIEASIIDGTSEFQRVTRIYFPLLMPTFTSVSVLMFVWTMTAFSEPYILGGLQGGINGNMDMLTLFLYRNVFGAGPFSMNFLGMGSAISTVILLILVAGALLIMRGLRSLQVEY